MAGGLSRVTIVAPHSRVDMALPSDVPLADLLPTVLGYAIGDRAETPVAGNGWSLSRLRGGAFDSSYSPAQLDVLDGELLYLRPRGEEIPNIVFDDVVDAIATGTRNRTGRWTSATTRLFGLALGVAALLAGAVAEPFAGPPHLSGGLIGLGLAAVLLVVAVVFARALGDARTGMVFALVAVVYAAIGGLLVLAGDRSLSQLTGAHVLISATAVIVVTTLAAVGVASNRPIFLSVAVCAVAVLMTAAISLIADVRPSAAAAIIVLFVLATLPALPMLAYRLVGLPAPTVPTEREQLRQDTESVDGTRVLDLGERADAYLAAMIGALAAITAGSAVLISLDGVRAVALCVVLGLLPLLRARWFLTRVQRLPLLIAGGVALTSAAVATFLAVDHTMRLIAIFGTTIAVAAISIGVGLAGDRRRASPAWGRVLDIIEVLLILTLVPLALWASGLYAWIRAIRG